MDYRPPPSNETPVPLPLQQQPTAQHPARLTAATGIPEWTAVQHAHHAFVATTDMHVPFVVPHMGFVLPQGFPAYPHLLSQHHYMPLPLMAPTIRAPLMDAARTVIADASPPCLCDKIQAPIGQRVVAVQQEAERPVHEPEAGKLVCPLCRHQFTTSEFLENHIRLHHESNEVSYEVPKLRGRKYFRDGEINTPAESESSDSYACLFCDLKFAHKKNREIHMLAHTSERPYACDRCPWAFTDKWKLAAHQRTHSGLRPYICPRCNESFTQKPTLTRHLRTHTGERPYVCRHCPATFLDSKNLSRHNRVHGGKRGPYACTECNASFKRKQMLTAHRRVHNGSVSGGLSTDGAAASAAATAAPAERPAQP